VTTYQQSGRHALAGVLLTAIPILQVAGRHDVAILTTYAAGHTTETIGKQTNNLSVERTSPVPLIALAGISHIHFPAMVI